MFFSLLRPAEGAAPRRGHVRLPVDSTGFDDDVLIVCIVRAKTRHRAARVQSIAVREPMVIQYCTWALASLPPSALLLSGGTQALCVKFDILLDAPKLAGSPYTPACLRPGGAVEIYKRRGASLLDVMFAGRWGKVRTLSHYLQEGFASLAATAIPREAAVLWTELALLLPSMILDLAPNGS